MDAVTSSMLSNCAKGTRLRISRIIPSRCSLSSSGTITLRICWFDHDCSAVREHFRYSRSEFRGVVTSSDNCVGSDFRSVLDHDIEGIFTRLFTELGPQSDVPSNHHLQCCAERRKNIPRAHHDAAHHAQILDHSIIRHLKSRSHHTV